MTSPRPYDEWSKHCTDKAKSHSFWILQNWNVRKEVRGRMWRRCVVSIDDWDSDNGGGWTHWGDPLWVELCTRQDMAIVHEFAHVAAHTLSREDEEQLYSDAIRIMLHEANKPKVPPFTYYRNLAHDYAYGTPGWPEGMKLPYGAYRGNEIWAGFCSARLNVSEREIPPSMKHDLLDRYFAMEEIYLPVLMG